MSPFYYASYQSLLNDRLDWFSQSFGHQGHRAIAFVPREDCVNPEFAIARALNLFANFDPRPRNPDTKLDDGSPSPGEYPVTPKAYRHYDMTYICISEDRVRETLTSYFRANLPRELGQIVRSNVDSEDGPDIDFVYDEGEVGRIAAECANHFIENEIRVRSFMSAPSEFSMPVHGVMSA